MRPNGVADAQTVEIPSPPKELSAGTHMKGLSRELVSVVIEGNKVPKSGMDRGEKSWGNCQGTRTANRNR